MKTIFIRFILVWFILGQLVVLALPYFWHKLATPLEIVYAYNPAPAVKAALDRDFERTVEYEARRDVALVVMFLALDAVILFLFWNAGTTRGRVIFPAPAFWDRFHANHGGVKERRYGV